MITLSKYLFITGNVFDVLITAIGVLKYHWKEANPRANWIQPPELMIAVIALDALIYIPLILWMHGRITQAKKYGPWPDLMISSVGLQRLYSGLLWVIL